MAVESRRSESKLWSTISEIVTQEGLRLFDIEEPQGGSVLRVYISPGSIAVSSAGNLGDASRRGVNVSNGDSVAPEGSAVEELMGDEERHEVIEDQESVDSFESSGRGVGFDDCTRVCRKLLDIDEVEPFIPEGCLLEVSSPGVNRRLRYGDHFAGAVGERVKIKFRTPDGVTRSVVGKLEKFAGDTLTVTVEDRDEVVSCVLTDVKDARVEFLFDDQKKNKKIK